MSVVGISAVRHTLSMNTLITKTIAALLTTLTLSVCTMAVSRARQTTSDVKPACAAPHQDATINGTPSVDAPTEADGITGTTIVEITLTPTGDLSRAQLAESSHNFWLDATALQTARLFKYQPEKQNCEGVAGSYLVQFVF